MLAKMDDEEIYGAVYYLIESKYVFLWGELFCDWEDWLRNVC